MKKLIIASIIAVVGVLLFLVEFKSFDKVDFKSESSQSQQTKLEVNANYGRIPMHFEPNQGQAADEVAFLSRGPGYTLFLTKNEAVLSLRKSGISEQAEENAELQDIHSSSKESLSVPSHTPGPQDKRLETSKSKLKIVLRMKLAGANPDPEVEGVEELPGKSNYLIGNDPKQWRTNVPNYAKIKYKGVYPGIDVAYYGNPQQLEYDFIVAPGADPDDIVLHFDGAERMTLDNAGNLVLHVDGGEVVQHAPVSYQEIDGMRRAVASRYVRIGALQVGVEVGAYDPNTTLVIDPEIAYGTYLSGNGADQPRGLAVDAAGNRYIVGLTSSTDFPTVNPIQDSPMSSGDLYIAKLNPGGTALLYATYLGGDGAETAAGIGLDAAGNAYIAGETRSENFPVKNAVQPGRSAGSAPLTFDVFVAALNADGSDLIYSTYLGGSNTETTVGMGVDAAGNAYVAGRTSSTDFRVSNAFQDALIGPDDVFVAKFTPTGGLAYSTYLGGCCTDIAGGLGVDATGNAYVVGSSSSPDFPLRQDIPPFQGLVGGFVAKLNTNGQLDFASFFGFIGSYVAIDTEGQIYVWGEENLNFLTTPPVNAFQPTPGGGSRDGFLMKLNPTADVILYASYLGGSDLEQSNAIVVDADGNAYVYGITRSSDFPVKEAVQPDFGGEQDMFLAKVDAAGALEYATYLGGRRYDDTSHNSLAVDANGDVHFAFTTSSLSLPTAPNAFQPFGHGIIATYVAKIGEAMDFELPFDGVAFDPGNFVPGAFPLRNQYTALGVGGSGLANVTEVIFSPDDALVVSNVQASDTYVSFDLAVWENVQLGERDLILKKSDGQQINVTDMIGQKFIITQAFFEFNQAVADRDLATEAHRLIQIAGKPGVMRVRFEDDALIGRSFAGILSVTDLGLQGNAVALHEVKDRYTNAEVRNGENYLVIPYPYSDPAPDPNADPKPSLSASLPEGMHEFTCLLLTDDLIILGPDMKRQFVESLQFDVLFIRIQYTKADGTVLDPPTLDEINAARDFVKKVYPITPDKFTYKEVKEKFILDLPPDIE